MGELKITADGDVAAQVIGDDANGSTDSGSAPVKVGGASGGIRRTLYVNAGGAISISGVALNDSATQNMGTQSNDGGSYPLTVAVSEWDGVNQSRRRTSKIFKPQNAVVANPAGGVTGWTPVAGKKFRVLGYHLTSSVAENIILYDGTVAGGLIVAVIPSGAGGSGVFVSLGNGYLSDTADKVLTIKTTTTTGGTVSGMIFGLEE